MGGVSGHQTQGKLAGLGILGYPTPPKKQEEAGEKEVWAFLLRMVPPGTQIWISES